MNSCEVQHWKFSCAERQCISMQYKYISIIYFYEIYGIRYTFIVFLYYMSIAGDLLTVQEGNIREPNEAEECCSHAPCNSGH